MKRGLIMKVSRREAVILTKDGSFERVRLKKGEKPEVGQEYICPPEVCDAHFQPKKGLIPSFSISLVAIIVFVLFAGGMPFEQNKASAAAYVSFDINPSIEVVVDKEMNVIKVRTLNEDAQNLFDDSTDYENSSLLLFSDSLFKILKEYGYFDTHDDLLIASSLDEDYVSPEMHKRLEDSIEKLKSSKYIENTDVILSVLETTEATRNDARKNGLSMGKFLVFKDVLKKDDTLTIQQAGSFSYSELKKLMSKDRDIAENAENPEKVLETNNSPKSIQHTSNTKNPPYTNTTNTETSDTEDKVEPAAKDTGGIKEKMDSTAGTVDEKEEEKNASLTEPLNEPPAKNTVPSKEENKKENEKESRSESDKGKTSEKNDDEDDLQVKIKSNLRGVDKEDLSPRELRLIESLQVNIFNANGNSKDKGNSKNNENSKGNGKSEKNKIHPQQDKHKKGSHGKKP
ncbi:anti-sigma factor domain-containing protein [Pseudalkalibacillus salsuginis]|uniref:anti-sigma factor domain-containing protein n=1 Tax=Pseudalkalibacillus salsuginis TaxID=2910972 RepID=UPI001F3105DB|nr:anti-sigma factor domain-containing protein [Pseudalkalibacillus salsuginis]MCF6410396.1 anti-sigma factor domain-containing protein [Pseudalkalibacillus salsuginis]